VPPPPVAGATVGNGVAEGVRVGDGRESALRVADGLALGVADGLARGGADELARGVAVALCVGEVVGEADARAPGDRLGSVAEGVDPEHATINAETATVMVAKPAAVSLAPSPGPAVVRRIFMGLLMARRKPRRR
jgi:hypothetical protein